MRGETLPQVLSTEAIVASGVIGPFIGATVNVFLYGIIVVLTAYYFGNYRRDRILVKLVVGISLAALSIQTVSLTVSQWQTLVEHPGDALFAARVSIGRRIALTIVPIPVFLAKVLFAERCFWVSSNTLVLGIASTTIAISTITSLGFVAARLKPIAEVSLVQIDVWVKIYLWSTVLNDMWLCGTFAYAVRKIRRDLPLHPASDILLSSLVRLTLVTSSITTVGAIAAAVSQLFWRENNASLAFVQVLPQLYMLSLLLTLNTRRRVKAKIMTMVTDDGFVGPARQIHNANRERKRNLLPYSSKRRPSVQYASGIRGDAQLNGVGVDCESYERVEILEADSFYPRNASPIIETIDLSHKSIQLDPAAYHSTFDALVIPRRLFRELDLEVRIPPATSPVIRGKQSPVTVPSRAAFLQSSNPETVIEVGSVRTESTDSHKEGDVIISEFELEDMERRRGREEPARETVGMMARRLGRKIFPLGRQEHGS